MLHTVISEHLESFLQHVREVHDRGLPPYVENEFREYLRCGIHAFGFLRARCKDCGRQLLLPFSCKKRGACPGCNARRMQATAAHLTDEVLPDVPLRQWVLSIPFELRLLLARNAEALSAVGRLFVREVHRWQRERAQQRGIENPRCGAISFPQRFGGSLNLNVHYHVAVPDGVFTLVPDSDSAEFHWLPGPSPADLEDIALNTSMKVIAWLRRKGLLRELDDDNPLEPPERAAIDACLEGSLGVGELTQLPSASQTDDSCEDSHQLPIPARAARRGGQSRGFNVHAAVVVAQGNREGRERLLRYCARPPLSLERLSRLPDGRVAYAIRKPWGKQTHRVMSPIQFMARLAALVPPPRHPLIRFHGVFAPHSSWREKVAARKAIDSVDTHGACQTTESVASSPGEPASAESIALSADAQNDAGDTTQPVPVSVALAPERSNAASPASRKHTPGLAIASQKPYIDWAELLKRVHDVDALACPCGGRLSFIELVTERDQARQILESQGMPTEPPVVARARSPDFVEPTPDCW